MFKKQKKRRERNKRKHAWEVVVSNIKPRVAALWMTTESSVCISVPFTECSAHLSLYNEVVVWWITAQNKRKNRFAMKSRIFPLQFYSSIPSEDATNGIWRNIVVLSEGFVSHLYKEKLNLIVPVYWRLFLLLRHRKWLLYCELNSIN